MSLEIQIRKENPTDYEIVSQIIEKAFATLEISEHNEGALVERLRKNPDFIDELSLVAEINGNLIGHILFTPVTIENELDKFTSLVLAPVSVLPEYQQKGVGTALINAGHKKAAEQGFTSVILIGHPQYYPKFGYKPASFWGIKTHYDLPSDDVFMAIELQKDALRNISGMVKFPSEFAG